MWDSSQVHGHATPDLVFGFTRMIVRCSLSWSRALSASDADSLSALLGDCRIWGSEEDPQFPVDSSLFTKSLDILFLRLYDGSRGNQGYEYPVKTSTYVANFVTELKGFVFTS